MKKNILYILFLFPLSLCFAQDLHFSQFNEHHAIINPALTGVTEVFRASISYRDQWRSVSTPYKSFGVSFETRLNNTSWKQVDKFRSMTFKERSVGRLAWGLSVYGDRAGSGNLNSTQSNFSLATFVPFTKKSFLSIGLQASYIQRRLEAGKLIFPSQYSGYGYDPNLSPNEKFVTDNYKYFGFAGGAVWSYGQEDKRIGSNRHVKAKAGLSFYRLAVPHPGFFANKESLQMKYIAHGDVYYAPANFNSAIIPSFVVQRQGKTIEVVAGAMLKYYLFDNSKYTGHVKRSSIAGGIYYRNRDALIIALNFEKEEQYVLGLSYDINTSALVSTSAGRGALELTLRYMPPKAFLYQKKALPPK